MALLGTKGAKDYVFGSKFYGNPSFKLYSVDVHLVIHEPPKQLANTWLGVRQWTSSKKAGLPSSRCQLLGGVGWSELKAQWSGGGTEGYAFGD